MRPDTGTWTPSFCRTCHNACAVLVEVGPDGRARTMMGDRDNPVYGGYTCVKGRTTPALHNRPERLTHSLKRMPDGTHRPVAVDEALDDIAATLRRLLDEHGPRSIANYFGTAVAGTFWSMFPTAMGFMNAIGSPMRFSSDSIDQPGKALSVGCHGWWMAGSNGAVDPEAVLLVGANPIVSHSGLPFAGPSQWLARQAKRGMQLIVVDPRRTETAQRAAIHLQCRPGHDAEILAAMLRVVLDEDRFDQAFVAEHATGLDELRATLRPFDPATVAQRAGIDVDDLVLAARTYAGAARGYAYCATGPSMSGSSTLVEYLRLNLITLSGHWRRAGEPVGNVGVTIPEITEKAQAFPPFPSYGEAVGGERCRVRGLHATHGGMPTAALADEILLPGEGQVRALLSCSGNPAMAWPGQERTIEALSSLELLVSLDVVATRTGSLSHYVIATPMSLEVPAITQLADWSFLAPGLAAATPYGQYSPAVVERPPGSELIEEWEFYYELTRRLGLTLTMARGVDGPPWSPAPEPYTFDMERRPTTDELLERHMQQARIPLDELRRHPHGALFPSDARVLPKDEGWEGRLDLANADMMADLAAEADKAAARAGAEDPAFPYRLISRRHLHVYNSAWHHPDSDRGRPFNPAFIHPDDLDRLGIEAGDAIEIRSPHGAIPGIAEADATLLPGLVSMAASYGGLPAEDGQFRQIGSPTTRLCSAEDDVERYSGQPLMSDIPVAIRSVDPAR